MAIDPTIQGFLLSLAIFVGIKNFQHTSPFADMLPERSDYIYHPILSIRTLWEVVRLTEQHNSAVIVEKRRKKADDIAKRAEYRKAHGLDKEGSETKEALHDEASHDALDLGDAGTGSIWSKGLDQCCCNKCKESLQLLGTRSSDHAHELDIPRI